MSRVNLYVELSSDLNEFLKENGLSVEDIFTVVDPSIAIESMSSGDQNARGQRNKELVPLILASAASISILLLSLSKFCETIYRKPCVIEWDELEEVESQGKVLLDDNGNPQWKVIKKHMLFEPAQGKDGIDIEFSANVTGIALRVSSRREVPEG